MADKRKKLLTISDAVSAPTGLARIHRDIVTRALDNLSDVYEICTMGYGGIGTTKIKVPQFPCEGMIDWILPSLPAVCEDFFGEERGTIMFIWDAHRVSWFSQPVRLGNESLAKFPGLKEWLMQANIEKWLYCPIDSSGPNDRLSFPIALTLLGFDRLLAYGQFGEDVIRRTIGDEEANNRHLTHLPHGIDGNVFWENPRQNSRKLFLQYTGAQSLLHMLGVQKETRPIADDEVLISIVATNQYRKSFPLGIETASILARTRKVRLWIHTDHLEKNWSIPSDLINFGMMDNTIISLGIIPDDRMATAYSACDLSLGIGLGEGMGYPIHESLFCGTPCIHGNYGGAPEWMMHPDMLVEPIAYHYEGSYSSKRPVFRAEDWAAVAEKFIGRRVQCNGDLDWEHLLPKWENYLREASK